MAEDFSNEGLYRLLEKMDREHGDELKEIRKQTTLTNSRVDKLETKVGEMKEVHGRELGRLNSAVFPRKAVLETAPPHAPDSPAISLSLSPKMWALIMGAGGAFGMALPLLIKWAETTLGLAR